MIQFSIFTVAEVSYSALALLTSAREQKEETCLMRISTVQQQRHRPEFFLSTVVFFLS